VVDSANKNKFTKSDFSNNSVWPIYDTTVVVVPSVLDKTKIQETFKVKLKDWKESLRTCIEKIQRN